MGLLNLATVGRGGAWAEGRKQQADEAGNATVPESQSCSSPRGVDAEPGAPADAGEL